MIQVQIISCVNYIYIYIYESHIRNVLIVPRWPTSDGRAAMTCRQMFCWKLSQAAHNAGPFRSQMCFHNALQQNPIWYIIPYGYIIPSIDGIYLPYYLPT